MANDFGTYIGQSWTVAVTGGEDWRAEITQIHALHQTKESLGEGGARNRGTGVISYLATWLKCFTIVA